MHIRGRHGGAACYSVASQQEGPGFNTQLWCRVLSVWRLHVLSVSMWVCPGFLSQSKGMRAGECHLGVNEGLSRVFPALHPLNAVIGSSTPTTQED